MTQFCCGCSLEFGAKFIIVGNFFISLFYIAAAVSSMILNVPIVGFGGDMGHQVFNAAYCLFGMPFIVAAMYGVIYRQEPHLRLYLTYLTFSFFLDFCYVIYYLFINDACSMMPSSLKSQGAAFACGITRSFVILFSITLFIFQAYCIHIIWSMCEDIRVGGGATGFADLLESSKNSKSVVGEGYLAAYASSSTLEQQPLNYGSLSTPGIGGGVNFFGGTRHDVSYPPQSQ